MYRTIIPYSKIYIDLQMLNLFANLDRNHDEITFVNPESLQISKSVFNSKEKNVYFYKKIG